MNAAPRLLALLAACARARARASARGPRGDGGRGYARADAPGEARDPRTGAGRVVPGERDGRGTAAWCERVGEEPARRERAPRSARAERQDRPARRLVSSRPTARAGR